MPNVPTDLIKLADVLAQYRPKRGWWQLRIDRSEIQPYYVPGDRGIWLSKADVERLTAVRPYERSHYGDDDSDGEAEGAGY